MIQKSNFSIWAFFFIFSCFLFACQHPEKEDFLTVFENSNGLRTAGYEEGIVWWKKLDDAFDEVQISEEGLTDEGLPLHLIWIGDEAPFDRRGEKPVLFINNAIHPGEPDGVDASMMLIRDILFNDTLKSIISKNIQIAIIPYYNVGGARNVNSHSRANQTGPEEYGFRGNAMNLDLNRDFIKQDSRNARTFADIFQRMDPDLYIETHVSNGADYRHTITCLPTLYQKLDPAIAEFFKEKCEDKMYIKMAEKGHEMIPYMNVFNTPPDSGMEVFMDGPRYSSGYAALFQTPGFVTETHMLKPYKDRVKATYDFLQAASEWMVEYGQELKKKRKIARTEILNTDSVILNWKVKPETTYNLSVKGYAPVYRYSDITGDTILTYNSGAPVNIEVPYHRDVEPVLVKKIPEYYILENGFHKVKELLLTQHVHYREVKEDTIMTLVTMRIENFETTGEPYEGHYFHRNTTYEEIVRKIRIPAGSWIIPSRQKACRFLAEVFIPDAPDSYFNWNFFDSRLQQKEWYSTYVFEPEAARMLKRDTALKKEFEEKLKTDSAFAANPHERLYYLYKKSPHYEWQHRIIPVYLLP